MNNTITLRPTATEVAGQYQIPYVIMLNKKGYGFALDRGYRLLYSNITIMGRDRLRSMLAVAKRQDQNWSPTGKYQMPAWARKVSMNPCPFDNGKLKPTYYCKGFTAYWFADKFDAGHDKVVEAFENPTHDEGITIHYDSWSVLAGEIAQKKKEFRKEAIREYISQEKVRPFYSNTAFVRVYITHEGEKDWNIDGFLENFNGGDWHGSEALTKKTLTSILEFFAREAKAQNVSGTFHAHLEGEISFAESLQEAKWTGYHPWGENWEHDFVATVKI